MYGESPIRMIEKLDNQPHIKALKKDNPLLASIIEANLDVSTQYTGITDNSLYTKTKSSVAIIFLAMFLFWNNDCTQELFNTS
jgi:hypothetical protein